MHKKVAVILTVLLLLPLIAGGIAFPASAQEIAAGQVASDHTPKGTPIRSAEEFLAMKTGGEYYLAADITVNASYTEKFSGTIDGNGKTVTLSCPLFLWVEDFTMKNVVLRGTVDFRVQDAKKPLHCGTVAAEGKRITLENIANHADVYGYTTGMQYTNPFTEAAEYTNVYAGGLVGAAYGNTTLKQCENYGKITGHAAAGLVGRVDKVPLSEYDFEKKTHYTVENEVLFEACANHGVISDAGCKDLTVKEGNAEVIKTSGHLGGLLSHGTATTITFRGCTNTADILQENTGIDTGKNSVLKADGSRDEAKEHQGNGKAAGIAAYIEQSSSDYHVDVYFYNCRNSGNVTGWSHTGGFAGNIKGGTHVFGGENSGTVRSRGSYAAGIVAAPTAFYVITGYTHDFFDCINTGDVISHRLYAGGIFAYSLDRLNMSRCLNAGNVSAQGVSATTQNEDHHLVLCAGIVGYLENRVILSHCVNTGNIVSNQAAAGIFGKVNEPQSEVATSTYSSFISCFQSGDITVYARDNGVVLTQDIRYTSDSGKQAFRYYWSSYHAAGILGFSWGSGGGAAPRIIGCGVMGNISTDWGAACGFLGHSNTQYLLIQYNYFLGTLKGPGETELMHQVTLRTDYATEYVLTWNDRWDGQKYLRNNYCYADAADKYMLMQNNGEDVGLDGYEYFVTKEDVTSGRLAHLLDEAILKDYENMGMNFLSYVAQDLSGTGETHPTSPYYFLLLSDAERREVIGYGKAVVKNGDGYGNADLMIETEPPEDDPDTTDAEITTEPDVSTNTEVTTSDHGDVTTAPDPDATAAPESDPSDGTGEVPDSGCGSVIGIAAPTAVLTLLFPALMLRKKREDNGEI